MPRNSPRCSGSRSSVPTTRSASGLQGVRNGVKVKRSRSQAVGMHEKACMAAQVRHPCHSPPAHSPDLKPSALRPRGARLPALPPGCAWSGGASRGVIKASMASEVALTTHSGDSSETAKGEAEGASGRGGGVGTAARLQQALRWQRRRQRQRLGMGAATKGTVPAAHLTEGRPWPPPPRDPAPPAAKLEQQHSNERLAKRHSGDCSGPGPNTISHSRCKARHAAQHSSLPAAAPLH